jgi:hypothetical protein
VIFLMLFSMFSTVPGINHTSFSMIGPRPQFRKEFKRGAGPAVMEN